MYTLVSDALMKIKSIDDLYSLFDKSLKDLRA